jgi:hypothetical protein
VESEGCPVGGVVPVEVVPQHAAKLLRGLDVGAGGDQVTTCVQSHKTFFSSSLMLRIDNLHCLFPASLSIQVLYLGVSPGACTIKHCVFVFYDKWPDYAVRRCLFYCQSTNT